MGKPRPMLEVHAASETQVLTNPAGGTMPEKILIIDDDIESVEIMRVFLMRLGYQVIVAYGGALGLEMARQKMPDLIILDVMMPGMDGFEVARSLHRSPDTTTIPILMVTALGKDEHRERGYEAGADIYLTRPINQVDFQAHIKALLIQRKARERIANDRGYVVGVMAAKGGVGVSTTALNLAVAYSQRYAAPVIAAELCPGRGVWADELGLANNEALDVLLGLEPTGITAGMIEPLLTSTGLGVRLLLASNGVTTNCFDRGTVHFEAVLLALRSLAPLVVLDVGTHFSPALGAVMSQCNEMIVLTEPQPLAVRQTGRLLESLAAQKFGEAKPLSVVTVNRSGAIPWASAPQIERALSRPVLIEFPMAGDLAGAALHENLPLVAVQPQSPLAQQFVRLAEQVKTNQEHLPHSHAGRPIG